MSNSDKTQLLEANKDIAWLNKELEDHMLCHFNEVSGLDDQVRCLKAHISKLESELKQYPKAKGIH
jgi:hypothetical protein